MQDDRVWSRVLLIESAAANEGGLGAAQRSDVRLLTLPALERTKFIRSSPQTSRRCCGKEEATAPGPPGDFPPQVGKSCPAEDTLEGPLGKFEVRIAGAPAVPGGLSVPQLRRGRKSRLTGSLS